MSTITLTPPDASPAVPEPSAAVLPRVLTSVLVGSSVCASLAPSLLPRSALTQAIVTALLAGLGLGVSAMIHRLGRRSRIGRTGPWRAVSLAVASASALAMVVVDARWQNTLRSSMDVDAVGLGHWMEVASVASALFLLLYLLGAGLTALARKLGSKRTLGVLVAAVAAVQFAVDPALWHSLAADFSTSNSAIDPDLTPPTSALRAGSHESMVEWTTLGREGRKFVDAAGDPRSVRTYVGLDSAPTLSQRTELAVDEMARADAFAKAAVVVAIPTGSGWIDDHAVTGIEARFDGDVAVVGMQYSDQPSWATFLFAQTDAREAATELLDAVASYIGSMPEATRPALYTYGQSLGSVGGSAAYLGVDSAMCGALWAGPPAGAVDSSNAVVLANSSDPVVRWSTHLLFAPPELSRTRPGAPSPQWIPVVGFLQTTVDMVAALGAPPGHGHRYGADQGTALPRCRD